MNWRPPKGLWLVTSAAFVVACGIMVIMRPRSLVGWVVLLGWVGNLAVYLSLRRSRTPVDQATSNSTDGSAT